MKNYLKYSILLTLTLVMLTGIVSAVPPTIGNTPQPNPYESRPTANAASSRAAVPPTGATPTLATITNAYNGILTDNGGVTVSATGGTLNNKNFATAYVNFTTFQASPPGGTFDITWVSLQIKYQGVMNTTDSDLFRWRYAVTTTPVTATWYDLIPNEYRFDMNTGVAQVRSFSQLTEPNDGLWDWTDISNLKVSLYVTKVNYWDNKRISVYDVWLSVYSSALPPVSSTTMSLQPPTIPGLTTAGGANDQIFVEVYVNDAIALAGGSYQFTFDPLVLQGDSYILYYPFTDFVFAPLLDNSLGIASFDFSIPVPNPPALGDPEWSTGVTGHIAVARIYFTVVENPDNPGTPMPPNYSWLLFTQSFIGDKDANKIAHPAYDGLYGSDTLPPNTYLVRWIPASVFDYAHPITSNWVEEFPNPGNTWHLTSWTDNTPPGWPTVDPPVPDGTLNPSDQVDMTPLVPTGTLQWFHVDKIWEVDTATVIYVNMILTTKGIVPEFPLGIGLMMAIAPLVPIAYLWRTRRRVIKK